MTEPTGPNPFAAYAEPTPTLSDGAPTAAPPSANPFAAYTPKEETAPTPRTVYKGTLLPLSRDDKGNVSFDPFNAGPIGALKQAFTLPGRVKSGEVQVDPSNPAFIGETLNFAGSFGPTINPAVRSGDRAFAGVARNPVDPTSARTPGWQQLKETGGKQIDDYQKAPINYNPQHMPTLAQQVETALIKEGVHETDSPGLYAALGRLRANVGQPGDTVLLTPGNLISIRKNIAAQFDKPNESSVGASIFLKHLDDFIANPPKGAVLARPAAATGAPRGAPPRIGDAFAALDAERLAHRDAVAAGELYAAGRGNYAAGMRAQELENIKRTADLRTGAAHSGLNADNTLRGRIASHVLNDRAIKGYTPSEVGMLEAIPTGTLANNLKRGAGNILAGGGGIGVPLVGTTAYHAGNLIGLGAPTAAAVGVGAPMLGMALKRSAGQGTKAAIDEASTVLRQRSPMFREQGWQYGAAADPNRDRMARTLMQMQSQAGQGVPVDQPRELTAEELQARGVPRITVTPYM